MKILVIHPADPTTDFLKKIYSGIDCNVVTGNTSNSSLKRLIKEHDRVFILGHGAPYGLFGHGRLIIDSTFVDWLRGMDNNVYIWCNADKFVERYGLKGFYSGMFISEPEEADFYKVTATKQEITYSNEYFSEIVNEMIDKPEFLLEHTKSKYKSEDNKVIQYNNMRLYYR